MKIFVGHDVVLLVLIISKSILNVPGYTPIAGPIKQKNFKRTLVSSASIDLSNVRVGNPSIINKLIALIVIKHTFGQCY